MKKEWALLRNSYNSYRRKHEANTKKTGSAADDDEKWAFYDAIDVFMSSVKRFDGPE
jgi:hypothetical protein